MADQAAIRLAFARVHESLDELERELLAEPGPERACPNPSGLCTDPNCQFAVYEHSHGPRGVAP